VPGKSRQGCVRRAGAVPLAEQRFSASAAMGVGDFRGPRRIDKVVLHAASVELMPIEFSGQFRIMARRSIRCFTCNGPNSIPGTLTYTVHFTPVVTNNIRCGSSERQRRRLRSRGGPNWRRWKYSGRMRRPMLLPTRSGHRRVGAAFAALAPTQFSPQVEDLDKRSLSAVVPPGAGQAAAAHRVARVGFPGQRRVGRELASSQRGVSGIKQPFEESMPLAAGALTRTGNVFRYAPVEVARAYEQVVLRAGARGSTCRLLPRPITRCSCAVDYSDSSLQRTNADDIRWSSSKLLNYVGCRLPAAPDFGTVYITRRATRRRFTAGRRRCFRRPRTMSMALRSRPQAKTD